jgi:hypothetical protein
LALVQELVKLHGGSVRAESRLGEGSALIVSVPLGKAHLPPEQVRGARAARLEVRRSRTIRRRGAALAPGRRGEGCGTFADIAAGDLSGD